MSLKRSNAQEGAMGVRDLVGSQRSIPFLRRLTVPAQVAAYQLNQVGHRSPRPMPGIRFDRDVPVRMRDGARLMTNVFRPEPDGRYPVVMSITPYGRDVLPDRIQMLLMRLSGVRFGKLDCSNWTGFEAPDPLFWTTAGYAVVQADARGSGPLAQSNLRRSAADR